MRKQTNEFHIYKKKKLDVCAYSSWLRLKKRKQEARSLSKLSTRELPSIGKSEYRYKKRNIYIFTNRM